MDNEGTDKNVGESYWASYRRSRNRTEADINCLTGQLSAEASVSCHCDDILAAVTETHECLPAGPTIDTYMNVDVVADGDDGLADFDTFYDCDSNCDIDDDCGSSCASPTCTEEANHSSTVSEELAAWPFSFNIPTTGITALLHILKQYIPLLPCDARTLLHIQTEYKVTKLSTGGEYYHFGLAENLKLHIDENLLHSLPRLEQPSSRQLTIPNPVLRHARSELERPQSSHQLNVSTPVSGCEFERSTTASQRELPSEVGFHTEVLKLLLRKINSVDDKVNLLLRKVSRLSNKNAATAEDGQVDQPASVPDGTSLPLDTVRAVSELECKLRDNGEKQKLMNYLCLFGGRDLTHTVCHVMAKLMTNSLAQQYNWIGTAKKHAFWKLVLHEVVCDAVRSNVRGVTNAMVEQKMKCWLRQARDRDGGRKRRYEASASRKRQRISVREDVYIEQSKLH